MKANGPLPRTVRIYRRANFSEYEKALRYLFINPYLDDKNQAFVDEYYALCTPLQLNAALCALKTQPPVADEAEALTTQVIERKGVKEADIAKAYFRRALARSAMKRDDDAKADLAEAQKHAPNDAGIQREAAALEKRRQARVAKQRAAYSKMFSS